ncbi:hypothetical protein FJZ33_12015 [Candidatus Poribacteria bacterium]|nr:hypothetical protein [Candidatus Poribacteria bacterium]
MEYWIDNKSYPPRKRRKRLILWAITSILAFSLIFISSVRLVYGFQYWQQNKQAKESYIQSIEKLKLEQQSIKEEIDKLQNSILIKERLARELGYIKTGEIIYRITPSK